MRGDGRPRLRPLLHIAKEFYLTPRVMAFSMALILLMVAADVALPWMAKIAIDLITEGRNSAAVNAVFREVVWMGGMILGVAIAQYLTSALLTRFYTRVVYRGTARLREQLYTRMQAQSLNFLAERQIGEMLTHLITDIQNLQDSTLDLISEVPFDVCILLGLTIAMFILNPTLALIVLLFLVASVLFVYRIGRRGWKAQSGAMQGTADMTARMQEGFAAARTIATFDAARGEQQRVQEASQRYAFHMENTGKVRAVITPFLSFAEYAGVITVLVVGGWEMLHGSLTVGGLVAFMAYMQLSADPVSRFSRVILRLQNASVSAARLHDLLAETHDAQDKPDALVPTDLTGAVAVANVHFRYPTSAQPALSGLDFTVAAGEKIAVVGRNASGKSTFLDLLLRIQEPEQGRISVDGIDVRDIRLATWRSFIGVVPQDILLLNRSVAENIALGSAFPPERIREAAAAAGLREFINGLPRGYETVVGERGVFLSGGERQRIAVARLFLRAARVILLDEPTSALDVAYESDLLPALRRLCAGRTTFIVSHRLTVLTEVDKVLLLDAGRQLAFDSPAHVWRDFPAYRDLFPASWGTPHHEPHGGNNVLSLSSPL
ncbi:MAG: ABC transporter ATP-binding protein [Gammaproteobacteria bacterium]|nr:ABC transporter ATP-binding protein [Gammaproteobacteria bacterium]